MYSLWALASVAAFVAPMCVAAVLQDIGPQLPWYGWVSLWWAILTMGVAIVSFILCLSEESAHRQRHQSEMEGRYMKALRGE